MPLTLREHALMIEEIVMDARTAPSTGQKLSTKQLLLAGCRLGGREGKSRTSGTDGDRSSVGVFRQFL
jgi:hypothetical protein